MLSPVSARSRVSLGEDQVLEAPDAVGLGRSHGHPARELFAELLLQSEDLRRSAQLEDVDGVDVLGEGHDGQVRCDVPHRECDVGVRRVSQVGEHESRVCRAQRFVGGVRVGCAGDHRHPVRVHFGGLRRVRLDDVVREGGLPEPLDETARDLVVAADDHVVARSLGRPPRRAQTHLGLEPRGIEEADEGEGQHDQ
jgi:hypothetical protein